MEQLAMLNFIAGAVIAVSVVYGVVKFIAWVLSLFGGICIGC